MFGSKKEKDKNEFGDDNYTMKNKYNTGNLFVASLQRISSVFSEFGPDIETTEQKYVFEKIVEDDNVKYREVFTGFTTKDTKDTLEDGCVFRYFDLPYVYEPLPFTDYFPEVVGITIPKLSLIWALNDINYSKRDNNSYQLKKD